MLFLSASIFLSAILVVPTEGLKPLTDLVYLFDVISDAPVEALKDVFKPSKVRHSLKVIAENRYCFVIRDLGIDKLRQLNFPEGSTVRHYPLQHASDYFGLTGLKTGWEEDDKEDMFKDMVLTMGWAHIIIPEGTSTAAYSQQMFNFAQQYVPTHKNVKSAAYFALTYYPPMFYYIVDFEPNAYQHTILDGVDALGGPASMQLVVKHVTKI